MSLPSSVSTSSTKRFFTLFVTIDIIGAIPIILSLKSKGKTYHSAQVGIYSGIILIAFLLVGEPLLGSFGADISTFGVAGGIVLFVMAVEMIFGIEIFKSEDDSSGNTTLRAAGLPRSLRGRPRSRRS